MRAFAKLDHPRQIRVAPNGDIFVAETDAGRIARAARAPTARPSPGDDLGVRLEASTSPFGIAFWPRGPKPRF